MLRRELRQGVEFFALIQWGSNDLVDTCDLAGASRILLDAAFAATRFGGCVIRKRRKVYVLFPSTPGCAMLRLRMPPLIQLLALLNMDRALGGRQVTAREVLIDLGKGKVVQLVPFVERSSHNIRDVRDLGGALRITADLAFGLAGLDGSVGLKGRHMLEASLATSIIFPARLNGGPGPVLFRSAIHALVDLFPASSCAWRKPA